MSNAHEPTGWARKSSKTSVAGVRQEQSEKPKVTVLCISYNSEAYLAQCLNAVLAQETEFRFQVLVHDDASTDSTQRVIQEFVDKHPDRIVPIVQTENQYSKGISPIRNAMPFIEGDFVAFCEADDYWIDKTKLQRQFEFLERNPDRNFVGAKCQMIREQTTLGTVFPKFPKADPVFFIKGVRFFTMQKYVHTSTFFIRRRLLDYWGELFDQMVVSGDLTILLTSALMDRDLAVLNSSMSHYRVHGEGSWTRDSRIQKYENYAATWRTIAKSLKGRAELRFCNAAADNVAFFETFSKRRFGNKLEALFLHGVPKVARASGNLLSRRIAGN
jgi:glycosyltransferase involved in cell wall biosynthesis